MNNKTQSNKERIQRILKELPLMLLFCAGIAVFLFLLLQESFLVYFIYAQCIGLGIFFTTHALLWKRKGCNKTLGISLLAIPIGALIGISIASQINGDSLAAMVTQHPQLLISSLAGALVFGTAISYYFFTRAEIAESRQALENEIRLRSEQERHTTETRLKLLQAQIEPHFLFNTLSNVLSLVDNDKDTAKRMLSDLTRYLRASLIRTRTESTTLGDEVTLLEAYLDIQSIRMGDRLQYRINIAESLRQHPLPPLLIQPLVENALKHAIEPEIDGGKIQITAFQHEDYLMIEVSDTGRGFNSHANSGIGLENIRLRLRDLYNNEGKLRLTQNQPKGVIARIAIPFSPVMDAKPSIIDCEK